MKAEAQGIFLGFDYGTRKTGVAVGEPITKTARPLAVLSTHAADFWPHLEEFVDRWRPVGLVVGVVAPDNPVARPIERFCRQLELRFRLPIHRIDETMTSQAAEIVLRERFRSSLERRRWRDAVAAMLILEDFLQKL